MSRAWTDAERIQQPLALVGTAAAQHLSESEFEYFFAIHREKTGPAKTGITPLAR